MDGAVQRSFRHDTEQEIPFFPILSPQYPQYRPMYLLIHDNHLFQIKWTTPIGWQTPHPHLAQSFLKNRLYFDPLQTGRPHQIQFLPDIYVQFQWQT